MVVVNKENDFKSGNWIGYLVLVIMILTVIFIFIGIVENR